MKADDIKELEKEADGLANVARTLEDQADFLRAQRGRMPRPDLPVTNFNDDHGLPLTLGHDYPEAAAIWRDVWDRHGESLVDILESRLRSRAANYRAGANLARERLDNVLQAASVAALRAENGGRRHGQS